GCLFGNGERTGNVNLVTQGLNMFVQGIDPMIDFSDIDEVRRTVEYCNQLPVAERTPYGGDLVFTAFSGSHQDAIKKGFAAQQSNQHWDIPYLPIDPRDLGRTYESVIRVNSQSGKGGMAWLLERDYGLVLPRRLQIEFSPLVQAVTDASGKEVTAAQIWSLFEREYLTQDGAWRYRSHRLMTADDGSDNERLSIELTDGSTTRQLHGEGNGPIDALVRALGLPVDVLSYEEKSMGHGSEARAAAFVEITTASRMTLFGVGVHANILTASILAVLSAVRRAADRGLLQSEATPAS
ncbi:MAG TPA: 2-isopropylmalate synthase, partial [Methylococcaceae bacterium]|nr:2-isopropylmalate synthase [Methylococcaceae bacterium]